MTFNLPGESTAVFHGAYNDVAGNQINNDQSKVVYHYTVSGNTINSNNKGDTQQSHCVNAGINFGSIVNSSSVDVKK